MADPNAELQSARKQTTGHSNAGGPSGKLDGLRQAAFASQESTISAGENSKLEKHLGRCALGTRVRAQRLLRQHLQKEEDRLMASGKSDELKGRVKEAAGALTGDKKLKREGKADQAVGKIKQKVEKVIDKVKEALS
jgi:uncharacterized protein YjbJ (UPF0337 family)